MSHVLEPFFARQGVVIVDGGLATELEVRGEALDDPLWSAALLLDRPVRIAEVHRAYLEAGADCIVTASYQASFEGLARRGLSSSEAEEVLRRSVHLAVEVRDVFWDSRELRLGRLKPLVAASVGPYGAYLADGSEYRGEYELDVAGLVRFHRRRLRLLSDAGPDLLACETIPSMDETEALVELLRREPGPPAWMSFSCRDGTRLWDGTPLARAVAETRRAPRIVSVGVNCTDPRFVGSLLAEARRETPGPLIAYPNSGERWDGERKIWHPAEASLALHEQGRVWRELGARLLGGCCRIGPAEIARLRSTLLEDVTPDVSSDRSSRRG